LALLNVLLWFAVPAISAGVDELTGRRRAVQDSLGKRPNLIFMTGAQELFVYFDTWLARGVFPVIYIAGLAVLPLLKKPAPERTGSQSDLIYAVIVSLLLIGFEMVWLFLLAVAIFLRGPDWNLYWPGEAWDPYRIVPINNVNLSTLFWTHPAGENGERPWFIREWPGLVSLSAYFVAGAVIAWALYRRTGRTTPYWRWLVLLLLVLIAALVPLKMLSRWVFNIKYLLHVPEYWINV
jgi:hypothetical protein